jgi:hypothetical protein
MAANASDAANKQALMVFPHGYCWVGDVNHNDRGADREKVSIVVPSGNPLRANCRSLCNGGDARRRPKRITAARPFDVRR